MPAHPSRADAIRVARPAGALYLLIIVLGLASEIAIRSALAVPGDPVATASNILEAQGFFRASIMADAVMATADIALAVLLFWLLRPVSTMLAALAAAFRLSQTAVIAGNLLNQQAALIWLTGGLVTPETAAALAYQSLELHGLGYDLGLIFFAVNSILTGVLLIRSGIVPRIIGQMLAAAGIVYLTGSTLQILAPGIAAHFAPAYLVAVVAETALAIRLLTLGPGRGYASAAAR